MTTSGTSTTQATPSRADEVSELLAAVESLLIPFIRAADTDAPTKAKGHGLAVNGTAPRTALVEQHPPEKLGALLDLELPEDGVGKEGLLDVVQKVLRYSVNTWDQGFMDKLYASTNAVGVVSELILSVLNTNVHVYQVSPALTMIEKYTGKRLAQLCGFTSPYAGGMSQPGGSAANSSSIVIARNSLYPETKEDGIGNKRFVLFTSAHGHYSLEKAAQMFGFGGKSVRSVPVDSAGRMDSAKLRQMVVKSKEEGETPFYVNATAGTTVLGSYDPLDEIADVCEEFGLWLHVDGSWGGPVIFNQELAKERMKGLDRVDSMGMCPHKMLGVPMTCSFLCAKDMRRVWKAMTLPAGYLFHNEASDEIYDLADLTPQCGRRGDALKLFLSCLYYGTSGLSNRVGTAFSQAEYFYTLLSQHGDIKMVSQRPLPCLQVCFYYAPGGNVHEKAEVNSKRTEEVARRLVTRGWMVDYAPGEKGKFFRVVVNSETLNGTLEGLVKGVVDLGKEVVAEE